MPHVIAVDLGLDRARAQAIIAVLDSSGLADTKLLIYHNCSPGIPVGAIPYGTGFPQLPWFCPLCEDSVQTYDELSFDIEATTRESFEIT